MMIYVPDYKTTDCVVYNGNGVIRKYDTKNFRQGSFDYIEYHINDNYYTTSGSTTFSNYSTSYPSCANNSDVTTNYFYRVDFSDILLSFFIMVIICFYLPYKVFSRLFGKWLKL